MIFNDYFYHYQTARELSIKYGYCERWIRQQIDDYQTTLVSPFPRAVTLVMDATFFGKRADKFGVLVAKDVVKSKIIAYQFIQTEKLDDYTKMVDHLQQVGFVINGITIDGKRGLFQAFPAIPVQMCHFHQQAIMTRYLTQRPKLPASIDLRRVAFYLNKVSEKRFMVLLDAWHNRYADFLNEKTLNQETRKWRYTHRRLRSAYRSIRANTPYLFVHKKCPKIVIPNTTNALDGGTFSPLKTLLRVHRGISKKLKTKLIVDYLENH